VRLWGIAECHLRNNPYEQGPVIQRRSVRHHLPSSIVRLGQSHVRHQFCQRLELDRILKQRRFDQTFGIGEEFDDAGERLSAFGIKDVEHRTHQKRMTIVSQ
jgi:hypothetical protein